MPTRAASLLELHAVRLYRPRFISKRQRSILIDSPRQSDHKYSQNADTHVTNRGHRYPQGCMAESGSNTIGTKNVVARCRFYILRQHSLLQEEHP